MKKVSFVLAFIMVIMTLSFASCGTDPKELYFSIATELETSDKLLNNYFANKYDLKDFNNAVQNARTALDNSDEKAYQAVLSELQKQNKAFEAFINDRVNEIYNAQTSQDNSTDYPFKVDVSELPENHWSFKPLILQSSMNPTWIMTTPPETTDANPSMCIFFKWSAYYDFDVRDIDTKKITVQNENGELTNALVNTEVKISVRDGFNYMDEPPFYTSNPAYLLKNKSGSIMLAVKCRDDGSDYFILYK